MAIPGSELSGYVCAVDEEVGALNTCQIQLVGAFSSECTTAKQTAVLLCPLQDQVKLTAVCCKGKASSVTRSLLIC